MQSGIGESNPSHSLGKAGHGRYTNPATNAILPARPGWASLTHPSAAHPPRGVNPDGRTGCAGRRGTRMPVLAPATTTPIFSMVLRIRVIPMGRPFHSFAKDCEYGRSSLLIAPGLRTRR